MGNLNNDGFFQAIAAEQEAKKPGKPMAWYLKHWKPGNAESDLAFMTTLLQEPMLKLQPWTNEDEKIVFKAKEFSLTIRPNQPRPAAEKDLKIFIVTITSVEDVTLRFREFWLTPGRLEEITSVGKPGLAGYAEPASTQFQNILELWKAKQPVVEFDPFGL